MKRALSIAAVCALAAMAVYAITNIVVTVPLPEAKFTNMVAIASNQNMTVEAFLTDVVVREIEGQRLGMMIDLWHKATPAQQQNALDALKPPPPPPPEP